MDWIAASPIPWLPTEVAYLALSVVLLFAHINFQSMLMTRQLGSDYNTSPRDNPQPVSGVAGRAERALRNFNETFPAFVALALAVTFTQTADWWTGLGAALYFWARLVYLPLYLTGIQYWRSLVYLVSVVGMVILFLGLVF